MLGRTHARACQHSQQLPAPARPHGHAMRCGAVRGRKGGEAVQQPSQSEADAAAPPLGNSGSGSRRQQHAAATAAAAAAAAAATRRATRPAVADAASLLQALQSLASSTTIILGSHQAYAVLETLEGLLPAQLPAVPTGVLASGLWAMARLQLQPEPALVRAVAQHLLLPPAPGVDGPSTTTSSSSGGGGGGLSRLAGCSARMLGSVLFSLNFFLLRDAAFWGAAAAAALPCLRQLSGANISNLLQGLAASGWVVDPAALQGIRQAAAAAAAAAEGSNAGQGGVRQPQGPGAAAAAATHDPAHAVLQLLHAVEASLVADPSQLRTWRVRDIAAGVQAYALLGYPCAALFAVIAQHLLSEEEYQHVRAAAMMHKQSKDEQGRAEQGLASSGGSNVMAAAAASAHWHEPGTHAPPPAAGGAPVQPWHVHGRGARRLVQFSAGDAVAVAWAYVHAFCANRMLLHELALVLRKRVQQLHAADVSRLLWAYATAGVSDARMLSAVTGATCEEVHSVLPRTAAGAVWALGRLQHQAPAFMEAALDRLAACMEASLPLPERAPPAAGAGAGVQPPSMLQQLYQQPPAAWLDVPPANDAAEDAAVAAASSRLQQQMGQQLSDVELALLASSDADERGRALRAGSDHSTSAPAEQASWLHKQLFPGFEVSSSSTEAGTEQPLQQQQALQALQAQQQQGRSLVVTHSDIAQAAWAAGRLRHYSMAFFVALRPRFVCLLPGFTDSQLVQVLWGLARLNLHHAPNMDAAAQELARRAPRLSGPLVALSAWAFASLRHRHEGVLAALTARAAALAGTDHGQPLPQPYWQQPLEPLGPLEPLELQQQQQQQQQPSRLCLRPLDARQLVYAAARLSYNNPLLLRTCAQVLKRHLSNLDMAVAVTGLWGFAVAGHYDEALTAGLLRVAGGRPVAAYGTLSLLQLFQAVTLLQDSQGAALSFATQPSDASDSGTGRRRSSSSPRGGVFLQQLPPALAGVARYQWLKTTLRTRWLRNPRTGGSGSARCGTSASDTTGTSATSSTSGASGGGNGSGGGKGGVLTGYRGQFADEVAAALRDAMGRFIQSEVLTDDGLFSIDLGVVWRGRRVAVEVDGPQHFTRNQPYVLLGSSAAKQRCLQARGWAVVSVPFFHWQDITRRCHALSHAAARQQRQQQQQQHRRPSQAAARAAARGDSSDGGRACDAPPLSAGAAAAARLRDARAAYLTAALDAAVRAADLPLSIRQDPSDAAAAAVDELLRRQEQQGGAGLPHAQQAQAGAV